MRYEYYKLDDNKIAIPCTNIEWAEYTSYNERHVGDETINGFRVSTVFLGLNHQYDELDNSPLIFETMIFGDYEDEYQNRCSTWVQAELMHETAKKLVLEGKFDKKPKHENIEFNRQELGFFHDLLDVFLLYKESIFSEKLVKKIKEKLKQLES